MPAPERRDNHPDLDYNKHNWITSNCGCTETGVRDASVVTNFDPPGSNCTPAATNAHKTTRITKLGPPDGPGQLPVTQTSGDTNFRRHQLPGANFWRDLPNHTNCNNATINIRIVDRANTSQTESADTNFTLPTTQTTDDTDIRRHQLPGANFWREIPNNTDCNNATINIRNRAKIGRTASADT